MEYFYASEADLFSFYKIPKELIVNPKFKKVSSDAKILYGLLLDRNSLSRKNNWIDLNGRVYIYFSREEVMELLDLSKGTVIKLFKELVNINLIEEVRQGLNKPNIIYVGRFISSNQVESMEVQNLNFQKSKNYTTKSTKNKPQEVQNLNPNYTYNNNTDLNDTKNNNNDDVAEIVQIFKNKYKADLDPKLINNLINKKGLALVKMYLYEFDDYIRGKNINDLSAYFYSAVLEEFSKVKNQNIKQQYADFKQREYTDEDFEKLYANLNDT